MMAWATISSEGGTSAVRSALAAAGFDTPFDPGSFEQAIEAGLTEFNRERVGMGEPPVIYVQSPNGLRKFQLGDLPYGVKPRQYSDQERAGVEARRMNDDQARGWPKP